MLLIMANFKDDQVHEDKYLYTSGEILSHEIITSSIKALEVHSLSKCFTVTRVLFQKVDQTQRSRSQGKKCWFLWKGLFTTEYSKYIKALALSI